MKKHILTAILLLPLFAVAQIETQILAAKSTFGRYGANCTAGRGICSFSVFGEENKIYGITSWKAAVNMIILRVDRKVLLPSDELRIVGKSFSDIKEKEETIFVQQEPFILNKESIANLDLNPEYNTISAGNYDLHIGPENVEIVFTLKASK